MESTAKVKGGVPSVCEYAINWCAHEINGDSLPQFQSAKLVGHGMFMTNFEMRLLNIFLSHGLELSCVVTSLRDRVIYKLLMT